MNVNSATSAAPTYQAQALQKKPENTEAQQVAKSKDREQDEKPKQTERSETPPAPSVNTNGQEVGKTINVKA